jgi:hypothetical protein
LKCGAALSPGSQVCAACGTPIAAGTAVLPPSQPAAAPPSSGSNALKIVLIVVAVFVGLGILGAGAFGFFVWRVAHAIHIAGNGNEVTLNTPQGKISTNAAETFSSSDLGTDIYPGAQPAKGGLRMALPTGTMVSAAYLTSDSKEQVLAFYKSRLGTNGASYDTANGAVVTLGKSQQESVVVTITANPSEESGKTHIQIVHTTAAK